MFEVFSARLSHGDTILLKKQLLAFLHFIAARNNPELPFV